ncbi:MAG TPA: hypothetical protein VFS01_09585 [Rhizomicrobium sp.]|jgi:hypothetical protein|nr:hypothetical protein [Rhizomicrobium sp.]
MTNTLHRYGKAETFVDDYIVFSLPAKSKAAGQTGDALAAQKRFMTIAAQYHPVSLGDALHGGALRPTKSNSIFGHWGKRNRPNLKKVLDGMTKAGTMAAVFDSRANAEAFVKRIKEEDLGISVNISSSIENAKNACKAAGIPRHSIAYSLGFEHVGDNTPGKQAIMLSTMCGHGMVSINLAQKMMSFVRENRRSPREAAEALSRFCSCGIFNTTRAKRILEDVRIGVK